jgi:hypothetical protein
MAATDLADMDRYRHRLDGDYRCPRRRDGVGETTLGGIDPHFLLLWRHRYFDTATYFYCVRIFPHGTFGFSLC